MKLYNLINTERTAFAIMLAATVYVSWLQSHFWASDPEYAFGFLAPLFVFYVLSERKTHIISQLKQDAQGTASHKSLDWAAAAAALPCALTFFLGGFRRAVEGPSIRATFACSISLAALIILAAFIFSANDRKGNPRSLKQRINFVALFTFPALAWTISSPIYPALEGQIRALLLHKVVTSVFITFDILAIPLEQIGNALILPGDKGTVLVAEACSGIRSLTGCIFSGSFIAAVFMRNIYKKLFLIGGAVALAVFMNYVRSAFLTGWACRYGEDSISGAMHDNTSYAILGITTIVLFGTALLIGDPPEVTPKKKRS